MPQPRRTGCRLRHSHARLSRLPALRKKGSACHSCSIVLSLLEVRCFRSPWFVEFKTNKTPWGVSHASHGDRRTFRTLKLEALAKLLDITRQSPATNIDRADTKLSQSGRDLLYIPGQRSGDA